MRFVIVETKQYKKALKKYSKSGRFDQRKLETVVNMLACDERLPAKYRDHQLTGALQDFRELHVTPDLLLVYQKHQDLLVLLLVNLGSHAQLF